MAENFSPEEIEEFKECFSLYDRDGDGQISIDQLKLVMRSLEQCPTQTDIHEIARKSGKSKISFPEFLDVLLTFKTKSKKHWKDEIYEAFKAYDTKGAGYISMKDLRHVMLRTGEKLAPQEFEYLLYQAGISKSATQVNYQELAQSFEHL
eukprot:Seg529.8 transcript_id=Seg529.8/GoldUCD/mRNA.D3Y31 product=Calmodulin protein_id=Seg529.8/GoldUCD/D3Y31